MRRGRLEQIVDLLEAVLKHRDYALTRISTIANINYTNVNNLFDFLESKGFLRRESIKHGRRQIITVNIENKGYAWLMKAKQLMSEVGI
jgi:predicted transcriptional regulator